MSDSTDSHWCKFRCASSTGVDAARATLQHAEHRFNKPLLPPIMPRIFDNIVYCEDVEDVSSLERSSYVHSPCVISCVTQQRSPQTLEPLLILRTSLNICMEVKGDICTMVTAGLLR
jgi:hypothetical protein